MQKAIPFEVLKLVFSDRCLNQNFICTGFISLSCFCHTHLVLNWSCYTSQPIRFPIGGERITCRGSKLADSLGRTKLVYSLGKQQHELSISMLSGCAP